jgi:uncharacterized protein (DUF342 family)
MPEKQFEVASDLLQVRGYTEEEQLKLFIDVELLSNDQPIHPALLNTLLVEQIPKDQIDQGVLGNICEALSSSNKIERRRIARGVPAKQGIDGRLVFLKRKLSREPREVEPDNDEPVSVNDLGLFENIVTGDVVARIYPPQIGEPGKNAFGQEIPSRAGNPIQIQIDNKTLERRAAKSTEATYDEVVALVDGYLEQQGSKLTIKEVFVVPGNLDTKVGSLNFIGQVQVNGDVLAGFKIEAKKGIEIRGNVNRTELISSAGGIKIKGRFFGEGKGKLICAKQVELKSIQDGMVDCIGDIIILEEARNSILRSKATIQAVKAQIMGGKIYTPRGVQAAELSNEGDLQTEIFIGSAVETSAAYCRLMIEIAEHDKAITLLEAHLGPYAKNSDRVQILKVDLRKKLEALLKKHSQVKQSLDSLKAKQEEMLKSAEVPDEILVSVEKKFYAGCRIKASEADYGIVEPKSGPFTICYTPKSGEFSERDYKVVMPVGGEDKR